MDCLVMPVSLIWRRSMNSRMGYRLVGNDGLFDGHERLVTVVVGKERRVFMVEPFILRENSFRVLMKISMKKAEKNHFHFTSNKKRVIFVDVDSILFEHMMWLMQTTHLMIKEIANYTLDF
ncbi:hypothetical protein HN51_001462, partial [Arachis hypogaea]